MQAIYDHVKDRIKWNGSERRLPFEPIRIAWRNKTGNNADINSILINMLRTAGITADPVVLSTRENGSLNPLVALTGELNYLICLAEIDGKEYLLDATDKFRPLGMLPFRCLNKEGWVLNETRGRWIRLLHNEIRSTKALYDLIVLDDGKISGSVTITYDGFDAVGLRRRIHNLSEEGLIKEMIDSTGNSRKSEIRIKNVENLNEPLVVSFLVNADHVLQSSGQFSFFKPLFGSPGNPWIKDERVYPVDLGCPEYSNFIYIYHLPDGYKIGDLPQSVKLELPHSESSFTYKINGNGSLLTVNTEFNMSKIWFNPDEYPVLREFYTWISKKANETVILQHQ